jgi:hypothetical protein
MRDADSPNLYQAFSLNPARYTDPFGLMSSEEYLAWMEYLNKLSPEQQEELCAAYKVRGSDNEAVSVFCNQRQPDPQSVDAELQRSDRTYESKQASRRLREESSLDNVLLEAAAGTADGINSVADRLWEDTAGQGFDEVREYTEEKIMSYSPKINEERLPEVQQAFDLGESHWLDNAVRGGQNFIDTTATCSNAGIDATEELAKSSTEGKVMQYAMGSAFASITRAKRQLHGIAKNARWTEARQGVVGVGLREHFGKHGAQVGANSLRQYDYSSRITIQRGRRFTYRDRTTNEFRVGYWDKETGLFTATSQTRKDVVIMTHFPESWEALRKLPGFSAR